MATQKKIDQVATLKEKLSRATGVFFTQYHGLDVNTFNDLRAKLREVEAEISVTKNTLLGITDKRIKLEGPTATLFAFGDPLKALKVIQQFQKKVSLPTFKGGIFEDSLVDVATIQTLVDLPSKEVLIGQLLGMLNTPTTRLVGVLSANQRNLVYVLSEVKKKNFS